MSGRDWGKSRDRQRMRRQGVESHSAADIPFGLRQKKAPSGASSIETAAKWFRANRQRLQQERRHPVPELRERFGMTNKEAIAVIQRANEMERGR